MVPGSAEEARRNGSSATRIGSKSQKSTFSRKPESKSGLSSVESMATAKMNVDSFGSSRID